MIHTLGDDYILIPQDFGMIRDLKEKTAEKTQKKQSHLNATA